MPIDDALKEINSGKEKPPQSDPSCFGIKEILRSHFKAYNKIWLDAGCDIEKIIAFEKWIKFNEDCELTIAPIPRNELVELLGKYDPGFKELMETSDMYEFIDDPCNICVKKQYEKLKELTNIQQVITDHNIAGFNAQGQLIIIPDLEYMSIFIKEGEKLRKYAQGIKENYTLHAIIKIDGIDIQIEPNFKPFSTRAMAEFCKRTGTKEVKGMVREVSELITAAYELKNLHQEKNEDDEFLEKDAAVRIGLLKFYLFSKLNEYHPELCYIRLGSKKAGVRMLLNDEIIMNLGDEGHPWKNPDEDNAQGEQNANR